METIKKYTEVRKLVSRWIKNALKNEQINLPQIIEAIRLNADYERNEVVNQLNELEP